MQNSLVLWGRKVKKKTKIILPTSIIGLAHSPEAPSEFEERKIRIKKNKPRYLTKYCLKRFYVIANLIITLTTKELPWWFRC